jgi:hypothetical protein
LAPATSYVLDIATGNVTELDAFENPLWEADGKHLRATHLRPASGNHPTPDARWISLRARWDRESGTSTIEGRGSAQIPAPVGGAVAWSEEQRHTSALPQCTIFLNRWGGVRHAIVGRFCMGIADDRSVRWSPNGHWLAFPHPGPVPGLGKPGGAFVDVVSVEGGRYPALSAVYSHARPDQIAIVADPGSVWFDWSASGRFLAAHDGASDLRVYDFEAHGIALLGKGQKPMWSPQGAYLLILAAGSAEANGAAVEAFVLSGVAPTAKISLGLVRDARWLPAQACEQR